MSDKATIDALGYWVSRLSARVKALEDRNEVARAPGLHGCEEQCPDCAMVCDLKHYTDRKQLHHDTEGHVWSVPECCGRGLACGACDPEPVPEWRRLVDEREPQARYGGLGQALLLLSDLVVTQNVPARAKETLSTLVAVCESEVGNGWKANPDDDRHWHIGSPHSVQCLVWMLDGPKWRTLGNRAAAWLRDITEATP